MILAGDNTSNEWKGEKDEKRSNHAIFKIRVEGRKVAKGCNHALFRKRVEGRREFHTHYAHSKGPTSRFSGMDFNLLWAQQRSNEG